MKNIFLYFIIIFALTIPQTTKASHGAGAELRYEHLTDSLYRFHFTFYRDCSGIPVNHSYTVTSTNDCGLSNFSFTVDSDSTVEVTRMCLNDSSKCKNYASPHIGIQATYYHGDVVIASPCSLWTFAITPVCNRNAAITNLIIPTTFCIYVETTLNNDDVPYNSSPVYEELPLFVLCDQVQYIHLYATDPDGDSLAFEMYTPHSDATTDVQYIAGITATQPVTYAVPADSTRFNPATGDIRFKADGPQITVVAVRVDEFRNGILIGSFERDIQVLIESCGGNAPVVTNLTFVSHICADSLLTIHVNGMDADGDSVRFSWINNIPGSSISLSGPNNHIADFSWQPTSSQISPVPYTFIIYVTDSSCPYIYYNSYQYHIYVDSCFTSVNASFTSPQYVCPGNCITFINQSTNATSYQWYFPGATPDTSSLEDPSGICYSTTGNYDVQLIVSNPSGSDTLLLPNYITVFPAQQVQSITQVGDSLFAISGAATYQWYFNNVIIPGATSYAYLATANGNYSVSVMDNYGCFIEAQITEVIVGVNQPAPDSYRQLAVVPNPVTTTIDIPGLNDDSAEEIKIYNVFGEEVFSAVNCKLPITNCELSSGLYYLEISFDKNFYRTKFIKQ
jgi:hypothetical protein